MADTNKKEYTSNLHPKGDMDTTVYPNVKSENIIDKDTTAYTAGKVPDSSLVSRSLDGISENLETTKIQVATNKNNIETLQGNYTGLQYQVNTNSSDIALTKTQVETNKTNIAKNTQDIENLSAVMPTDINVDANGYAILEHDGTEITGQTKKVKFAQPDKPASFSEVTIPTASALKTKDGTSFGGGDTSSIPTDINVDSEYNLILEHDGTEITGQKKLIKLPFVYGQDKYDLKSVLLSHYDNKPIIGNLRLWESSIDNSNYESSISCSLCFTTRAGNAVPKYTVTVKNGDITVHVGSKDYSFYEIIYSPQNILDYGEVYIRVPTKSGTLALTSDLDAKQSTLYRHTVTIYKPSDVCFRFTDYSVKNTPIDSIQNLIAVFGNTKISGSGSVVTLETGLMFIYIGINVGTTINNTFMINSNDLEEENFTDVFGTTGFTITDEVTAM